MKKDMFNKIVNAIDILTRERGEDIISLKSLQFEGLRDFHLDWIDVEKHPNSCSIYIKGIDVTKYVYATKHIDRTGVIYDIMTRKYEEQQKKKHQSDMAHVDDYLDNFT